MSNVAIVHRSGFGHTQVLAEAVAAGARAVPGARVSLIPVADAEARAAELDAADAIVFGSPTYMGSASDVKTVEALGRRVAEAAGRWTQERLARAA